MEYLNALVGNTEMYIPVNEKIGTAMLLAHKRLNYKKHIARMRHAYKNNIETGRVEVSADFFYVQEDVFDEQGYPDVIHHLFDKFSLEDRKLLYALFREDKTVRFLIGVQGYKEEIIQKTVRAFFEKLKQKIF